MRTGKGEPRGQRSRRRLDRAVFTGAVVALGGSLFLFLALSVPAPAPAQARSATAARSVPAAPPAPAPAAAQCKKDADCVLVPEDCCSCSEGGAQRALASKERDGYERHRVRRCTGIMCGQMMSNHPSCSQRAACVAGACKLR